VAIIFRLLSSSYLWRVILQVEMVIFRWLAPRLLEENIIILAKPLFQ